MRVHHISCLSLCPPFARLIDGKSPFFSRGKMVCHCLLIETDAHGLVLVDTAIGLADCADVLGRMGRVFALGMGVSDPPPERTAIRQIEAMGFRADDVKHIVLTHLDLDHAGGLPDFPHAKVHLMTDEKDAAMARRTFHEKNRYRPHQWAHDPKWVTYDARGETWRGLSCVRSLEGLPPEILLIPMSGHTRGHACVAVESGTHTLVHCGDAYFFGGVTDPDRGPIPSGIRIFENNLAIDFPKIAENHAKLRDLAKSPDLRVFCAHDPVEYEREATRGPV